MSKKTGPKPMKFNIDQLNCLFKLVHSEHKIKTRILNNLPNDDDFETEEEFDIKKELDLLSKLKSIIAASITE